LFDAVVDELEVDRRQRGSRWNGTEMVVRSLRLRVRGIDDDRVTGRDLIRVGDLVVVVTRRR